MRSLAIILALFTSISVNAEPNENGVEFLFPTPGLTLNYLDTINVTYISPFPKPLLYTFCTNKTDTKKLIEKGRIAANPYNSSHLFTFNFKDVNECYWNLRPNTSAGFGGNSLKVKLITEGWSSTTIGLTPTQLPGVPNPATPSPAAPNPPAPAPTSDGLSTGAKAGTGAGVGAVALIAIAFLALFLIKKRKNKASTTPTEHKVAGNEHGGTAYPPGYTSPEHQYQEPYKSQPHQSVQGTGWEGQRAAEMPTQSERPAYEMSSEPRVAEVPGSAVNK